MKEKSTGEWEVQIDKNTGKERDDYYYLYCKQHGLPCAKSPWRTEKMPDTAMSKSKTKKRKERTVLNEEAIYRLYSIDGCDFYEIALSYDTTEGRVKKIVERFELEADKRARVAKADEARHKRDERIVSLHKEGKSRSEIAKICGCSTPTVANAIKGKAAMARAEKLVQEDGIRKYYAEGKSVEWLMSFYDMPKTSIYRILRKGDV